jgi:hypothetical protein
MGIGVMNVFTADADFMSFLVQFTHPTEIRTLSGEVVGYFTPVAEQETSEHVKADASRRYAEARSHFDPQELKRRKTSNEFGVTTAEVLARLPRVESP